MKSKVSTVDGGELALIKSDEFKQHYLSVPEMRRIAFNWRLKWLAVTHPYQILLTSFPYQRCNLRLNH
jgi:hypothetical protein